mmetsp:Transcript_12535/g.21209  ORF Transcript_12535/g.21209 Transcript_12535/m.21209 type:complete len:93 (+) Transcript_12535:1280-1558(+)
MVFIAHCYGLHSSLLHPSSQTEKLCLETDFEAIKALLVVVVSFELINQFEACKRTYLRFREFVKLISRLPSLDIVCRWKRGLFGTFTSTAAH